MVISKEVEEFLDILYQSLGAEEARLRADAAKPENEEIELDICYEADEWRAVRSRLKERINHLAGLDLSKRLDAAEVLTAMVEVAKHEADEVTGEINRLPANDPMRKVLEGLLHRNRRLASEICRLARNVTDGKIMDQGMLRPQLPMEVQ